MRILTNDMCWTGLRKIPLVLVLAMSGLVLGACSDDDDDEDDDNGTAANTEVRVLHAVSDAPRVNVYVDGELVLGDVDFRAGSAFLELVDGSYDIRVEAIVPSGNIDIIEESLSFDAETRTTILAVGNVGEGTVGPLVVANPAEEIGAGNARLQVTHASPEAGPVCLAVTSPDFPIDQADPLGPLNFQESTGGIEVPADNYQVRVLAGEEGSCPPFTDEGVVFDSGEITLPEGADLQAVAVTSTVPSQNDPAGSPISVVLLDGAGSADLFDASTGADLRVVHNSFGAPPVDVIVDVVDTPADEDLKIVSNLSFGNFAGYLEPPVAPVAYDVDVAAAADNNVVPLSFTADLMPGVAYTAIANNVFAEIEEWILVDDYRRVATEAKVRLVHGSTMAGPVDIYVIPSDSGDTPATTDPAFSGVVFGTETGFVSLAEGTYDVFVTGEGSSAPAISAPGLTFSNSGIYTAIARDPLMMGGDLGLILLDDFNE